MTPRRHLRLQGKCIVVTGAASGIGKAVAINCAREGAHLVLIDQDADGVFSAVADLDKPKNALAIAGDVADPQAMRDAMLETSKRWGGIDGLVNNAGIARRHRVTEQDESGWDEVMRVNARGTFICSKYALPHLIERRGAIVNIASVVGLVGVPNRAVYASSKGAIIQLTRNMALDYARAGVRVNCICPGFTRTGMTRGLFSDAKSEARIKSLHPLGRLGEPEDIASGVIFLLSKEASWITGQALAIDGGFTLGHGVDY